MIFIAMVRFSDRSNTRLTSPIPPVPMTPRSSYRALEVGGVKSGSATRPTGSGAARSPESRVTAAVMVGLSPAARPPANIVLNKALSASDIEYRSTNSSTILGSIATSSQTVRDPNAVRTASWPMSCDTTARR